MAGPGRPGRPRRDSNSTVATVDEDQIRYRNVSTILKPAPPNSHNDDWPCFVLTDATVYLKDGKTPANLTHVDLQGPFIVRGQLEVEESEHRQYLHFPRTKTEYVEIPASYSYSIGFGPYPVVWASGEPGWFEINPSPKYQSIYNDICEAITLYYKVMDIYEAAPRPVKKKGKKLQIDVPLDTVFFKYAVAVGDGSVRDEVEERCHKHAQFLLAHFPKELMFKWKPTNFYKWMADCHQDITKKLMEAAAATAASIAALPTANSGPGSAPAQVRGEGIPQATALPSVRSGRSTRSRSTQLIDKYESDDVEMTDVPPTTDVKDHYQERMRATSSEHKQFSLASLQQPTDREHSSAVSEVSQPSPSSPAPPKDPVGFLLKLFDEIEVEAGNPANIKPSTVHTKIYFKCTLKKYKCANDITGYYAKSLMQRLPPQWQGTPYFNWLKQVSKRPFQPEVLTVEEIPHKLIRRKKSAVRPSLGVGESSAVPQRRLGSFVNGSGSSTSPPRARDAGKHLEPPMIGRRSGKGPTLRLASGSKKRPASDLDDGDEHDHRGKRTSRSHSFASGYDDDSSEPEASSDDEDSDEEASAGADAVRIVIRAENIPSTSPTGPNGTWTCAEPGCGYVVRNADEEEGQDTIAAHFRAHQSAAKIDLAQTEGTRGHLPIDHLLEKIRSLGRKEKEAERLVVNGTAAPKPIKRRLLL